MIQGEGRIKSHVLNCIFMRTLLQKKKFTREKGQPLPSQRFGFLVSRGDRCQLRNILSEPSERPDLPNHNQKATSRISQPLLVNIPPLQASNIIQYTKQAVDLVVLAKEASETSADPKITSADCV